MIYLLALLIAAVVAGGNHECNDPDCRISTIPRENDGRRDR